MKDSESEQGQQKGGHQEGESSEAAENGHSHQEGTSPIEWVFAIISAVFTVGAIGFLIYDAISSQSTAPLIDIQVNAIRSAGDEYVVDFTAVNHGETAANLVIEGTLNSDTSTIESSSVTINYVPGEASRSGFLFFSHDPNDYDLVISPKGSERP